MEARAERWLPSLRRVAGAAASRRWRAPIVVQPARLLPIRRAVHSEPACYCPPASVPTPGQLHTGRYKMKFSPDYTGVDTETVRGSRAAWSRAAAASKPC
jgi:hypothetical protein